MSMVPNSNIFYTIRVFIFKLSICKCDNLFDEDMIYTVRLFVNGIVFFFSKLIIFFVCSLNDLQSFFMQPSPMYTSCLFSIPCNIVQSNSPYHRPGKLAENMLSYVCCLWFFKIIFTVICFFNEVFKICINNRWCVIRFLVLIRLKWCLTKFLVLIRL